MPWNDIPDDPPTPEELKQLKLRTDIAQARAKLSNIPSGIFTPRSLGLIMHPSSYEDHKTLQELNNLLDLTTKYEVKIRRVKNDPINNT